MTVGISNERVHTFYMKNCTLKAFVRDGYRFVDSGPKFTREDISTLYLLMFNRSLQDFLHQFMTMDKTWIHHSTPECKQEPEQRTMNGESALKKTKTFHQVVR